MWVEWTLLGFLGLLVRIVIGHFDVNIPVLDFRLSFLSFGRPRHGESIVIVRFSFCCRFHSLIWVLSVDSFSSAFVLWRPAITFFVTWGTTLPIVCAIVHRFFVAVRFVSGRVAVVVVVVLGLGVRVVVVMVLLVSLVVVVTFCGT